MTNKKTRDRLGRLIGERSDRDPIPPVAPQEWKDRAACKNSHPDVFFPTTRRGLTEAQTICNTCPVIEECLDYATRLKLQHGVFGGLSASQRVQRWRKQGRTSIID